MMIVSRIYSGFSTMRPFMNWRNPFMNLGNRFMNVGNRFNNSIWGGPSFIPRNNIMTRPFGIPIMPNIFAGGGQSSRFRSTGFRTPMTPNIFAGGGQSIRFRNTQLGYNPFAANVSRVNANGVSIFNAKNNGRTFTGISNAQTGTRFGQLTTPNGSRTRVSGNINNYRQTNALVNTPGFTGKISRTSFTDDKYRYTVTNRRGRLNAVA